jgi:AraC family transcriptional regulator
MAEATQTYLFQSNVGWIGQFRCRPSHPCFEQTGPAGGHLVVFPRTSVCITHAGGDPIVADPNVVMFYNQHQEYRRSKLSERGDLCEFFSFSPHVVTDALHSYDPSAGERPNRPFSFSHGPSDTATYLLQRLITERLVTDEPMDVLEVEEAMLAVLGKAIENAYRARGLQARHTARGTERAHRTLANEARSLLATRFQEQLSLADVASALHTSPFHLCRVFRQVTGASVHRYLDQIRLLTALELVAEATDITELALELGYSSHSHFTQAFRRTFGVPPSTLRRASQRHLREIRQLLTA